MKPNTLFLKDSRLDDMTAEFSPGDKISMTLTVQMVAPGEFRVVSVDEALPTEATEGEAEEMGGEAGAVPPPVAALARQQGRPAM